MINRYLRGIFIQFHTFYVTSIPPSGIITENLRLACLHCTVTAVVGWHLARLVNAKVRVRTPVKPEAFFIRMSPAFTKFKWWELFVMSAWETYQLDRKLIFHLHDGN